MIPLRGVLGPVVTPFDAATEEVDLAGFAANVRAHLEAGLTGVVVAGSTGEAALLDEAERQRLVETARAVVPRDRLLVVGTGAESTRLCVRRSREAAALGADAVLVVAPHYYATAMTSEALAAHFERVADESTCPVLLYNIPKYAHFALPSALVERLAAHANVIGMKDSAGDLAMHAAYLGAQHDGFAVLTGHAGTFLASLERGTRGGILAVALFAPELALDVWHAARDGDDARAGEAQRRLQPLGSEIVARLGVAGVKAALDVIGLRGGSPRLPLLALRADAQTRVHDLLRDAGVALTV